MNSDAIYHDEIKDLPSNNIQPDSYELNVLNSLFSEQNSKGMENIMNEGKKVLIPSILFFILSLPFVNNLFTKFKIPLMHNPYFLIVVKTLSFMVLLWVISNLALMKT